MCHGASIITMTLQTSIGTALHCGLPKSRQSVPSSDWRDGRQHLRNNRRRTVVHCDEGGREAFQVLRWVALTARQPL